MCESCEYCWYTYYVNAICYAFLNPLHILILAAECNSSCCRCLSPSSCPKSRSHACNWWIDFICVLYLRWAYLPESCTVCAVLMQAIAHTQYVLQLQQLALRHARCTDMSLDCPYLCLHMISHQSLLFQFGFVLHFGHLWRTRTWSPKPSDGCYWNVKYKRRRELGGSPLFFYRLGGVLTC